MTGLISYFDNHLFSSYEVGSWKPAPGLFLHAAQSMGFSPRDCVVVEDSEVGIEAAIAAGMKALQYTPESEGGTQSRCTSFSRMTELPALLRELSNA